jgi:hypothetical protein
MSRIADKLIEFVAVIYPESLEKQEALMEAILERPQNNPTGKLSLFNLRLTEFTPKAFREAYEQTGQIPLQDETHLQDICNIIEYSNATKQLLVALQDLLTYVESPVHGGRTIAEQDADGDTVPEVRNARIAIMNAKKSQ